MVRRISGCGSGGARAGVREGRVRARCAAIVDARRAVRGSAIGRSGASENHIPSRVAGEVFRRFRSAARSCEPDEREEKQ